jgi:cysteine synthase A
VIKAGSQEDDMPIYPDIQATIGKTPLVRLNRICTGLHSQVFAKLEMQNPLGSVKDRIGYSMIREAEKQGLIQPNTLIVEPTSGNTGIALAFICAAKGYRLCLTMPETMSLERRKLLKHLGADLVLTPAKEGMTGAIEEAHRIVEKENFAYMPNQFANPANPKIHRETTAEEIWKDTGGKSIFSYPGSAPAAPLPESDSRSNKKNPRLKRSRLNLRDLRCFPAGKKARTKFRVSAQDLFPKFSIYP